MLDQDSNSTASVEFSRRRLLAATSGIGALALAAKVPAWAAAGDADALPPYGNGTLPSGVRARLVPNINGLTVNMSRRATRRRGGRWC